MGMPQLPDGGPGQPGGCCEGGSQRRVPRLGLRLRGVEAQPDHVGRLCRRIVNGLGELDPLALERPLPLHRRLPPGPFEPGDESDIQHQRVHPSHPDQQLLLMTRDEVQSRSDLQAYQGIDPGRDRRPG